MRKKVLIILGTIVAVLVIAVLTIIPPSFGYTKPFLSDGGMALEGSISQKTFVEINGTSLGMFIMAKDDTKPVLLLLGGGPGIPEYLLEQQMPSGLEEEFVVCYLEYRGTSLSYNAKVTAEDMTLDQYVEDVVGVTNYLRDKFGHDKIYLMGHSFGTYIGINVADRHPELYHAYIAMAQISDTKESETRAYDYMLGQYRARGDEKMVKRFEEYPIATSEEAYAAYSVSDLRDKAMHDLGVGTTRAMRSVISGIFFPSLRCAVYTPIERINIWRGKGFAQTTAVAKDCREFNAFDEIPEIDIPIYFFAGLHDYTVAYSLQQEYYEAIRAPHKAFYTFDESAHSPLFEEPGKAMEILVEDVLAGN